MNRTKDCYKLLNQNCLPCETKSKQNMEKDTFEGKKVNRNVQGMPQSQTAANPRHQEEEKNNKQKLASTNAWEAHRPATASQSEVITMVKRTKEHEDKEHGKTIKHEAPVA